MATACKVKACVAGAEAKVTRKERVKAAAAAAVKADAGKNHVALLSRFTPGAAGRQTHRKRQAVDANGHRKARR